MRQLYLFIILSTFSWFCSCKSVVIECTFPCSNNDVCEVNAHFVKCKQRTNTTKWVLNDSKSLPEYQGSLVQLGEKCIIAPNPDLKDASHLSANSSETILDWPPYSRYIVYDDYYSNCDKSLYCDKAGYCVEQFKHGEVCESDNQCHHGTCNQGICQNRKEQPHSTYNTIHIILTVVGIVLFLGLVFGAYMMRRVKLKRREKELNDKEQVTTFHKKTTSRSSTSTGEASTSSNVNNNNNNNMLLLHPDYDSAFNDTTTTRHNHTPSRQQQELQLQLQRQLQPASSLPPPPYSP